MDGQQRPVRIGDRAPAGGIVLVGKGWAPRVIGGSPDEIGELQAPVRGAIDWVEQGDDQGGEPEAAWTRIIACMIKQQKTSSRN